jgi:hypothetical protein
MEMPETKSDTQVLREAAKIIEERGHCKDKLFDCDGRVCMAGAINVALTGQASYYGTRDRTCDLLERVGSHLTSLYKRRTFNGPNAAVFWNNEKKRKASEVISALRHA